MACQLSGMPAWLGAVVKRIEQGKTTLAVAASVPDSTAGSEFDGLPSGCAAVQGRKTPPLGCPQVSTVQEKSRFLQDAAGRWLLAASSTAQGAHCSLHPPVT